MGYGYALFPRIDIQNELDAGKLIHLHPKKVWNIPLYGHYWEVEREKITPLMTAIQHQLGTLRKD